MKKLMLIFLFSFAVYAWADVVYLKDGASLKGKVVSKSEDAVVIKQVLNAAITKTSRISMADVVSIKVEIIDENKLAEEKAAKAKEEARIKQEKLKEARRQEKERLLQEKRFKQEQAAREKEQSEQILQADKQRAEAERLREREQEAKAKTELERLKKEQGLAEEEKLREKQETKARQEAERLKEKQRLAEEKRLRQKQSVWEQNVAQEKRLAEARQRAVDESARQQKAEQESRQEAARIEAEKRLREEAIATVEIKPVSPTKLRYKVINRVDKPFLGRQKMNRTEYTITVSGNYAADDLEIVCGQVLQREIKINKDLDALWVVIYNEKVYRNKGNPRAYAIWAPPNGWDDFANTTDKDTYIWDYRFLGR